ncbi:MAG TPA: endolytic transglycosylase MltG [Anaerolineales bacterium]|nr:endolytic transglycosylase MltG [Anaerolineales bacterium]
MPRRARRPRLWPWIIVLTLGCLIVGLAASAGFAGRSASLGPPSSTLPSWQAPLLGAYLVLRQEALDSPAGDTGAAATLEIEPGETASDAIDRLAQAGVVQEPSLLRAYLRYKGLDSGIEAGRYSLRGSQTVRDIAEALQAAGDSRYTLVIVEGWRREQIAQALGALGLSFSPGDFLAATRRPPPGVTQTASTLEGFLFPDTYRLDPRWTADQVVAIMLDTFQRRVDSNLRDGFDRQGLTLLEAVTLASIVEREAALPEERPLIASVFYNRLSAGMKLQSDPTVQFALGLQPDGEWWKSPLSLEDLATDSAYNTYVYGGLPPGPIANPGLDSLRAVARPADTRFYYFRAACDGLGSHVFAFTFEEHLQNACP